MNFFIRAGVTSLYLSHFFLFVCFVVVVVLQLFFSPLGFCASQVLLIFFRLSYKNQLGLDFYDLRPKLVSPLSLKATYFFSEGGHWREVQL